MSCVSPTGRKSLSLILVGLAAACSPSDHSRSPSVASSDPLIFPSAEATISPPPELQGARERIASLIESGDIPSMAVAVARGEDVIWQEAFGHADRESARPATPRTVYSLGSLSKSVFATGLMTLVDADRLDLATPVADILGEEWLTNPHGDSSAATVLDVLAMRAGVPHGWTSYADASEVPRGFETRKAHFGSLVFSAFPPGEIFEYSNFSYGVGELIIEGTTGTTIADYMQQAVFLPLGMKNSSADTMPQDTGDLATSYGASGQALKHFHALPGGGLGYFSSAHDLLRFGAFHLGLQFANSDDVLSVQSREHMQRFRNVPPNLFHLGWWGDRQGYVSNGSVAGANSHLKIIPGEDLVIVALTNRSGSQADQMADLIAGALIPGEAERSARAMKSYMDLHERPYRREHGFAGRWEGWLDPSGHRIKLSLVMDSEATLVFGGDTELLLENATTSVVGRIKGRLDPQPLGRLLSTTPPDQARLTLARQGEKLLGYLSVIAGDARKSISRPLFVRLSKNE